MKPSLEELEKTALVKPSFEELEGTVMFRAPAAVLDPNEEAKKFTKTIDNADKLNISLSDSEDYHDSLENIEKKKPIGFWEGLTEDALFKIPVTGPFLEGLDLARIKLASIRLNDPGFDWEQEAEREKRRLDWQFGRPGLVTMSHQQYLAKRKEITAESARQDDIDGITGYITAMAKREERGYNWWGRFGQGISILPSWMFEIALTGGLYRTGSAPVKKLLQKHAKSKLLAGTAGWLTGSAVATTVGMPQRTFANTMHRSLNEGKGPFTSMLLGWGDTFIEYSSEKAGEGILHFGKGAISKFPFGGKVLSELEKAWVKLAPENTAAQFVKRIATKGGYSSFIGEWTEERLATLLHGIVGTQTFGLPEGATTLDRIRAGIKQDFKWANMSVEGPILIIPGGIRVSVAQLGRFANDSKLRKAIETEIGVSKEAAKKAVDIKNNEGIEKADEYLSAVKTVGEKAAEKVITPPTEAKLAPEPTPKPQKAVEGVEIPPEAVEAEPAKLDAERIIEKVDNNTILDEQAISFIKSRMKEAANGRVKGLDIFAVSSLKTASNLKPIVRKMANAASNQMTRVQAGKEILSPDKLAAVSGIELEEINKYLEAPVEAKPIAKAEPAKVYYHGTSMQSAEAIKKKGFKPKIINGQYYGSGVYLAPTEGEAARYGDEVLPIKANLNNPFILDLDKYRSVEEWYAEIQPEIGFPLTNEYGEAITVHSTDPETFKATLHPDAVQAADAITGYLEEKGYDGLIVKEKGETREIVVFDPKQVDLAKTVAKAEPAKIERPEAKPTAAEGEKQAWQLTSTNKQASDLGFTRNDQAIFSMIENEGGQVNLSSVPIEDWYTYQTPEGLAFQSDREVIDEGGYSALLKKAKDILDLEEEFAQPAAAEALAKAPEAETIGDRLAGNKSATIGVMTDTKDGRKIKMRLEPDTSSVGQYSVVISEGGHSQTIRMQYESGKNLQDAMKHFEEYMNVDEPGRFTFEITPKAKPVTKKPSPTGFVAEKRAELKRLKAKRFKTANDEVQIERIQKQLKENVGKWQVGQGVGWRVMKGQTNRGLQIVEVYPDQHLAKIKFVADTGVLADYKAGSTQTVDMIDLIRDKKYDAIAPEKAPKAEKVVPQKKVEGKVKITKETAAGRKYFTDLLLNERERIINEAKGFIDQFGPDILTQDFQPRINEIDKDLRRRGYNPTNLPKLRTELDKKISEGWVPAKAAAQPPPQVKGKEPRDILGGVDPIQQIHTALKSAKAVQPVTEAQKKMALKARVGAAAGAMKSNVKKGEPTEEAIFKSTGLLKGPLTEYDQVYTSIEDILEPGAKEAGYQKIYNHKELRYFETLNTATSFKKLLAGSALTPGDVENIERVFGTVFEDITKVRTTKSSLYEQIIAFWKAGLLTGIKTTGLNTLANVSHSISETAKDVPATFVDSVASLFTKERTLSFTTRGMRGGTKEGFIRGWKYLKTGVDVRNVGQKLDYKRVNFGNNKFAKAIQAYEETIFHLLGAEDQPFYYGAKARSLYSQAIAQAKNKGLKGKQRIDYIDNAIQNPTDEMLEYSVHDAEVAVFQNKTNLGDLAKAIQKVKGGEVIVPFGRTPSAVAMQIVNYSPIGAVSEIAEQIHKGKFDQRKFSQAFGRSAVGTGALYIGGLLFEAGLMTLDYPDNEKERELWKLEGRSANTIKIGNKWRTIQTLGPVGNVLIIGGHFKKALKEEGSPTRAVVTALAGGAKSFSEQTFVRGVNLAVDALTSPERSFENWFTSMAGSVVPTIVADIARAQDEKGRRAKGPKERIQARIPVWRKGLEPSIDVFGQDLPRYGGNVLETMADPTRPSKIRQDVVVDELRRLFDKGIKVAPTKLGDKAGYDILTKEENTQLWRRVGELTYKGLLALVNNENYTKANDFAKGKLIEHITRQAKSVAKAEVVNIKIGQGKTIMELAESGLFSLEEYEMLKYFQGQSMNRIKE